MSEPRLISPMLDGCIIGQAISCHNGVRCCPAIRESTGEKYIVKIISIPASQVQLEALLLTGAYENKEAAAAYFMELAEDIVKEKDVLASLSRLEGFTEYIQAQVEPMENGVGYEVYLLSPYRRSVERMLATDTMTHLSVVNLGLDICAALAASRRAGFLYVDLKPENIFFTQEQDYRIGDLGFVPLSSLQYTTLPEKYHSPYAPNEVLDTMAVLNDTVDTYALGLILYQAYNGGQLPRRAEDGSLAAPMYADYELAEIILKACAADPADRWADPTQMGQALVGYMQRNTVNDEPIIPPVLDVTEEAEPEDAAVEEFLPETEPEPEELAFLQELTSDETAPSEENTENIDDTAVTEETSQMLAQADDLLAMELPDPVVAPEAIEVPMPEPIDVPVAQILIPEPEEVTEEASEEVPVEDAPAQEDTPAEVAEKAEAILQTPKSDTDKPAFSVKALVSILLVLVTLACAALGGWYYYDNFYLQRIDNITVDGTESILSVHIHSDISDELLTVYCTDSYGNVTHSPVTAGVAVFQGLNPSTRYSIRVEIGGMHKLVGTTTSSFTTNAQINILDFSAVIGATDGSALVSFRVDGNASDDWILTYSAEGVAEQSISFNGHSVMVNDLVLGSVYTFKLSKENGMHLNGTTETTLKAGKLVFAQDLTITACGGGNLRITWNAPEGETVNSWTVRCYNEAGYSQTVTTSDLTYTFTGLDHSSACTVEVFAENMSQSAYVTINANPITITNFQFDDTVPGILKLQWDFEGANPEGGWVLTYTVDGLKQDVLYTPQNSAELYVIPGSHYSIVLSASNGVNVFGSTVEYDLKEADAFAAYGLTAEDLVIRMCLRPDGTYWTAEDVPAENYTNRFTVGQAAALILHAGKDFEESQDSVEVTYLVRDAEGTLLNIHTANSLWDNIFPSENGALNTFFMPETPGEYTMTIYFNGKFVTVQNFSIV